MAAGKRLLTACFMAERFFDVVDIDINGSDASTIGPALDAVKYDGLLYLTCTDGRGSSGNNPERSLASYGTFTQKMPFHAEQGLRAVLGAALREAATRGLNIEPVFSLYSSHGPVFRVMVRVRRSRAWAHKHYNFVGYSHETGQACVIPFKCAPPFCYDFVLTHGCRPGLGAGAHACDHKVGE